LLEWALHTCANDRIGDAIVRRCLLLSSADSDEANDGANDPAIVRRSLLLSSADSDEGNDGANDPAIVRTEALYPLTLPTLTHTPTAAYVVCKEKNLSTMIHKSC
jgi:hypothetical protein